MLAIIKIIILQACLPNQTHSNTLKISSPEMQTVRYT